MGEEGQSNMELMLAARKGDIAYLQSNHSRLGLLDNREGDSVLSHAVDEGTNESMKTLEFLAETPYWGELVNRVNGKGFYPLLLTLQHKSATFMYYLLHHGARILIPCEGGTTHKPCTIIPSCLVHAPQLLFILLERLQDYTHWERLEALNQKSTVEGFYKEGGLSPYDLAELLGRKDLAAMLVAAGAEGRGITELFSQMQMGNK
jgi:hypothetical protein